MKPTHGAVRVSPRSGAVQKKTAALIGLVVRIVGILVVVGGAAAAYYYAWYLPRTPKAVLTRYIALDEKGDADATYRLLSQRSCELVSLDKWKWMAQRLREAKERGHFAWKYAGIGEPKITGDECRIPVTTQFTLKESQPGAPAKANSITQPFILLKEKNGWKVGYVEQRLEWMRESARKAGLTDQQIEQYVTQIERSLKQPPRPPR